MRQTDTRVSCCAFNDCSAWLEPGEPDRIKQIIYQSQFSEVLFFPIDRACRYADIQYHRARHVRKTEKIARRETERCTHRPSASAASTMPSAALSFTLLPGFWNSALP